MENPNHALSLDLQDSDVHRTETVNRLTVNGDKIGSNRLVNRKVKKAP